MTNEYLGWTPVSIYHLEPHLIICPVTFECIIRTDAGEDITEWLADNKIHWTIEECESVQEPIMLFTYRLLFKCEEDATMFALRWV